MFSQLEFLIAFRYLRSKRSEGFISIIAGFSLVGIILGVATLIIVMSVMNGFRAELIGRILGLNGHIGIYENQNNFQVTTIIKSGYSMPSFTSKDSNPFLRLKPYNSITSERKLERDRAPLKSKSISSAEDTIFSLTLSQGFFALYNELHQ